MYGHDGEVETYLNTNTQLFFVFLWDLFTVTKI